MADEILLDEERPLSAVLEDLGKRYQVFFSYNAAAMEQVGVDFELSMEESVEMALGRLLEETNCAYEVYGEKYFVVFEKNKEGLRDSRKLKRNIRRIQKLEDRGNISLNPNHSKLLLKGPAAILPRGRLVQTISGTVLDGEGNPLVGATVMGKETSEGGITDASGRYEITIGDDNDVLVVSYIGYQALEVPIEGRTNIDVVLEVAVSYLDEVVLVGYSSEKKINLTGSVSNIGTENISSRPLTNISSGLSGLAPGVLITQQTGGSAGHDGASIRIRGVGTFGDSNPLVVVDGVPSEGIGIINDIDPNDIENISILKDAASSAIYGSRGANGVVLITTKKGVAGKPKLTYNGYVGWQKATTLPDFVSDFALYMEQVNLYRGTEIFNQADIDEWRANPNDPLRYPNVDWQEEQVGGTGKLNSHNLSYSGGSEATQYRFSLSYLDQDGLVLGNEFQRYGLRTNMSSAVANGVKLGGNLFFRWSELSPSVIGGGGREINTGLVPGIPSVQSPDGRWGGAQHPAVGTINNPFALIDNNSQKESEQRLLGDVFASWEIIPGLVATGKVALNYLHEARNSFSGRFDLWDFRRDIVTRELGLGTGRAATSRQSQNSLLTTNLLLEYQKSLGKNNLKVLAGQEILKSRNDFVSVTRNQFPNNSVQAINAGVLVASTGGNIVKWNLLSYFGRLNYNYNEKYFAEVNFRADASSRFAEDNRWGYFPAFSVGWVLSKENFLKNSTVVDQLKLRASWGQLGNNRIGNYAYQSTYNLNQNYTFDGQVYSGIAQTALANEDILWEETTTSDIGLDLSLWRGKVNFTFDYFNRETTGILTALPVPAFLGDKSNPIVNLASMVNKGFEASLGYRGDFGDFKYNISGHITQTDNEVTDYFEDISTGGVQIGFPYNSFFGLEAIGIFGSEEEIAAAPTHRNNTAPGDIQFRDQITEDTDGDGIPDAGNGEIGSEDRVIIGNRIPRFIYGGNVGFQIGGFDLNVIIQGIADRDVDVLSAGNYPIINSDRGNLHQRWVDDAWSESNRNGSLPRLNQNSLEGLNDDTSTFWVKDLSFLRVKNLQVGYVLPESLVGNLNISRIRLYGSVDNLLTFSNEEWGFDPESSNRRHIPNVRSFILGANVSF